MAEATVFSRVKLTSGQLARIKSRLGLKSVSNKIDLGLAGGFKVQIDDRIIDFTVDSVISPKESYSSEYSIGSVLAVGDGIAEVDGLSTAVMGEIVHFEDGTAGLVLSLWENKVGVVVLGDPKNIKPQGLVKTTGRILSVPAAEDLLGRVVSPLGNPLDGLAPIKPVKWYPLEKVAPGVMARQSVSVPLSTGIKAVDAMIPIGRGQRELIIGDRQTGKTSIALTTIINQKNQGVVCVYVAIGQKRSSIAHFIATLKKFDALKHTVVVLASASDPAAMQYLAPYAGAAYGEYFLDQGRDALVVYDDLTKHAWAYRQVSLLLRRPSGREAYPGDIFYAHSRLLERACRLNKESGGGSLTAIPVIETQSGDLSAYIPTNVISITDGQLYLEADLFNAGQRPAINVGNSVSRVGGAAQIKAIKQVAGRLRLDLAQYRELQAFAQFATEMDERTQKDLNRGSKLTELLKQGWDQPMPVEFQVVSLWTGTNGFLDDLPLDQVREFESHLLGYIQRHGQAVFDSIEKVKLITPETEKKLKQLTADAKQVFLSREAGSGYAGEV